MVGAQKRYKHLEEGHAGGDEVESTARGEAALEHQRGLGEGDTRYDTGWCQLSSVSQISFYSTCVLD